MEITSSPATTAPTKFTEAEINELAAIRESFDQVTITLGQLEMQKRNLKKNEQQLNERIIALESQEKVFLDGIVAKYGEGSFDIATGIFTPKKV
jgi:hypothetical protein